MKLPGPHDFKCPECGGVDWGTFDPTPDLGTAETFLVTKGLSANAVGCCHGNKHGRACTFRWFRNAEEQLRIFTPRSARTLRRLVEGDYVLVRFSDGALQPGIVEDVSEAGDPFVRFSEEGRRIARAKCARLTVEKEPHE